MHHRIPTLSSFHYCFVFHPSKITHTLAITHSIRPLQSLALQAIMERSRSLCFLLVLLVLVSATTSSELPLLPPVNSRSPLVAVAASAPNQVELLMMRLIRTFFGDQVKWSPFLRSDPVEEVHHHHQHHHRVVREHRHHTSHGHRLHRKLAIPQ